MRAIVRLAAFASTCTTVLFSAIILLNNAERSRRQRGDVVVAGADLVAQRSAGRRNRRFRQPPESSQSLARLSGA